MEMNYCMHCGTKLQMREHPHEGLTPWCESCGEYRYPVFNTACSMIVMNEQRDEVLLIRQYGRPDYVLVAGYVNRGEDAEAAAARELREEVGLEAQSLRFNHSHYFVPTNTLMLNFTVTVIKPEVHANFEVDDWRWFSVDQARKNIKPNSLAEAFINGYFTGKYPF